MTANCKCGKPFEHEHHHVSYGGREYHKYAPQELISTDTLTVTLTVAQAIALVQGNLPSTLTEDSAQYNADFVAAQDVLGAALEEKARG